MMCPSGFFQSKVVSWKFLMGQLKSTVWPLMAVTCCHTARETASQWKWFQWEGVQTLLCVWERCRGGRQKEIFDETTPKDAAVPPVHTVLVWQEVCGQSFHGERESKQTCKIDIWFPVGGVSESTVVGGTRQVGLNNWRSLGHFFHMCGLLGRCHLILDEDDTFFLLHLWRIFSDLQLKRSWQAQQARLHRNPNWIKCLIGEHNFQTWSRCLQRTFFITTAANLYTHPSLISFMWTDDRWHLQD